MRRWTAHQIRDGIMQARRDAALVAGFGDSPVARRLDSLFSEGPLGYAGRVKTEAHKRTYQAERRIPRGLARILRAIESESEQANAGAPAETDFGCCEADVSCRGSGAGEARRRDPESPIGWGLGHGAGKGDWPVSAEDLPNQTRQVTAPETGDQARLPFDKLTSRLVTSNQKGEGPRLQPEPLVPTESTIRSIR